MRNLIAECLRVAIARPCRISSATTNHSALSTIWLRTGLVYRGWAILTYLLALILLLSVGLSLWITLIFPAWVLAVSVMIPILNYRNSPQEVIGNQ